MGYLAIVAWTEDHRVAKYAEFKTEADALKHAKKVADRHPGAFVAKAPSAQFSDWLVNPVDKTVSLIIPSR